MFAKFLLSALVAATTAALVAPATAETQIGISIDVAPPAPRYSAMPAPRPGQTWVPGYWDWRDQRHVWVTGSWVADRPGYSYRQPRWTQAGGRWQLDRGGWGCGDRDHDGVPNAQDRDRDGDGTPNRYDRAPNNPYGR